ncbi:hypothetical protein E2562_005278, partial [Oryza meyeriana var. granulata]
GGEVPALGVGGVGGEVEAEQDYGGAERAGKTGGADGRPRSRRANDGDVSEHTYGERGSSDPSGEVPALGIGGVGGEVEHVAVARVVDREEEPRRRGPSPRAPVKRYARQGGAPWPQRKGTAAEGVDPAARIEAEMEGRRRRHEDG